MVMVTGVPLVAEPSLPVVSEATLLMVPQVCAVVGETMWIASDAPGARLAKVQVSTCGLVLEIEHESGGVIAGVTEAIDHDSPDALGSVSVTVTLVAVPAPMLVTVMVKPTCCPALTVPLSAVLAMCTSGQLTVMLTVCVVTIDVPFDACTDALLLTVPHVAEVVGEVTSMAKLAPGARLAKVQVSTCGLAVEIEHPSGGVGVGVIEAMDHDRPGLLGSVSVTTTLVA